MFDKIFLLLLIAMILSLIFTILAFTQDKRMNVGIQMIKLKSGDEEIQAFLAVPKAEGKFPAVVLIHEWWGLTDWEKENAVRFASIGYGLRLRLTFIVGNLQQHQRRRENICNRSQAMSF
jgi:hypothetical protein